jgi:hypothetical protein
MMETVNRSKASSSGTKPLTRLVAGVVLAASLAAPSRAGQASGSFNVSITFVPATTSCSAAVNGGVPLVSCAPVATLASSGSATATAPPTATANATATATTAATTSAVVQDGLRFRLPDTRVRLVGAPVGVREEDASAWGEYSSRLIASGGIEYLEMTVTW